MSQDAPRTRKLPSAVYEAELRRLQAEFVKVQEWAKADGRRILVIFEGRDAAGKGGTITRITQYLSPRAARIAALPAPRSGSGRSGTSSATSPSCRAPARSCCSTAPGTTAPGWRR